MEAVTAPTQAPSSAVRAAQGPLREARALFAALDALAVARAGEEPGEDASQDEWRDYCEALGAAAEALGVPAARAALREAEAAMLAAVLALAEAAGVPGADVRVLRAGASSVTRLAAMLDLGMRLR